jgi:hypothetical protein
LRPETQTKAELRAERDHWKKLAEEGLDPRIKSMRLEDGRFDMAVTGPIVEMMAIAMVGQFKEGGAKNYMEMSLFDRDEPWSRYTVTEQKVGKLSPHDKVTKLDAALRDAESFIARTSGNGETDYRAGIAAVLAEVSVADE